MIDKTDKKLYIFDMKKKKNKLVKVLPIIIIFLIILLVSFTLITLGRVLLSKTSGPTQETVDIRAVARDNLLTVDDSHYVMMRVRSKIVGDESFNSYRIMISPSERILATYKGYSGDATQTKRFDNTVTAYEQFVYALDKANLVKGQPFPDERDDTRGICATGEVYDFDIVVDDISVGHYWSSTCRGSRGSLMANTNQIKSLFLNQIPDAAKIINQARKNK